jgi:hypothetical protein
LVDLLVVDDCRSSVPPFTQRGTTSIEGIKKKKEKQIRIFKGISSSDIFHH